MCGGAIFFLMTIKGARKTFCAQFLFTATASRHTDHLYVSVKTYGATRELPVV